VGQPVTSQAQRRCRARRFEALGADCLSVANPPSPRTGAVEIAAAQRVPEAQRVGHPGQVLLHTVGPRLEEMLG
jgi:hypothetical protein